MRTNLAHRVALVTALWSVLAGAVLARGASLCVGPDRHVALELPGTDCCPSPVVSATVATGAGMADDDCRDCHDTMLSAGGDLTTRRVSAAPAAPTFAPAALPIALAVPGPAPWTGVADLAIRSAAVPPPLSLPLRC